MSVVIGVLLGLILGLLLASGGAICVDRSIEMGDLINAGIAILIFFLANQIYSKVSDVNRRENDLLSSVVDDVLTELGAVETAFFSCWGKAPVDEESARALLSALRRFGNSLLTLEDSAKLCNKKASMPKIEEIKTARFKYKNLLTGSNFPVSGYDRSIWPRRETIHGDMLRALRKLQFDLNRD